MQDKQAVRNRNGTCDPIASSSFALLGLGVFHQFGEQSVVRQEMHCQQRETLSERNYWSSMDYGHRTARIRERYLGRRKGGEA